MGAKKLLIRSAFDGLNDEVSNDTALDFSIPDGLSADELVAHPAYSVTDQSHAAECDINTIVKNFLRGNGEPDVSWLDGVGADLIGLPDDYQSLLHRLNAAQDAFMSLPASVRARFENDPSKLVSFLSDDRNIPEAIALGIASSPVESSERSQEAGVDESTGAPAGAKRSSSKAARKPSDGGDQGDE